MNIKFLTIALLGLFLSFCFSCEQKPQASPIKKEVKENIILPMPCDIPLEKNYKAVYARLLCLKIPYPELFIKVSIYEAGWNYQSYAAKHCNNIFGFSLYNKEKRMMWPMTFDSLEHCIDYLDNWVKQYPPKINETGEQYLKRRNYNTENPNYYNYLKRIKPKFNEYYTTETRP